MTELNALHVAITGDSNGLSSAVRTANDSLTKLGNVTSAADAKLRQLDSAVLKSTGALTDMQRRINDVTGVMDKLPSSASASAAAFAKFDQMAAGVDNLRASFDPLFAASKRYESAVEQLDAALDAGAISQAQYSRILAQAQSAYLGPTAGISRMGGALGGLATRMQGARGQIQNVAFQLQDMAVQLQMGTAASVVFAQQGSQIAGAFGPVGAVIGALAAVGIPLLALAFSSGAAEADKLSAAAEHQKEVFDNLTASTYALRLERQALQSGAFLSGEQEALNEIVRLGHERVALEYELQQEMAKANDGMGVINQKQVEAIQLRLQENAAARAQAEALIENGRLETARIAAINLAKTAQQEVLKIMRQLQNSDISSPWQKVIGWIGQATAAAQAYAAASQTYGQVGARGDPRQFGANAGQTNTFNTSNFQLPAVSPATGGGGGGGGAAENPIQAELEALQQGLMSAEQLQMESYTRQQEVLNEALNQRLITQQEYQALMEAATSQHYKTMADSSNNGATQILGALGSLFEGNKKVGAGIALVNTMIGASEELKKGTFGIASAIRVIAQGMSFVRAIKSASSSGGGGAGAAGATAAPPQQNVQTLNFNVQNDQFGIGANLIRQIASQLNEAQRNGSTLIRATVA